MDQAPETQQEKETRWADYRAKQQVDHQNWRAARVRTRQRIFVVGGAIVLLIVVVIAAIRLL